MSTPLCLNCKQELRQIGSTTAGIPLYVCENEGDTPSEQCVRYRLVVDGGLDLSREKLMQEVREMDDFYGHR